MQIRHVVSNREICISNVYSAIKPTTSLANTKTMPQKKRVNLFTKRSRTIKRSYKKYGLLYANALLIVAVTGFVWVGHNNASSPSKTFSLLEQSSTQVETAPLDNLSSADIAANIALASSIPQETMVVNQADSFKAQLSQGSVEESVVTKPQIVTGSSQSKNDIVTYVSQEGETATSIAQKYGVSVDTVKWSNGLTTDSIPAGKTLKIPPKDGVIYTVKEGDTVDSLAQKYKSTPDQIVAFNDTEIAGLKPNDVILIPGGQQPAEPTPTYTTRTATSSTSSSSSSASSVAAVASFTPRYGGNGYASGYCTWYAASRVPVPNNWGNANTWDDRARASGWNVSSRPVAGAVAQRDGGYGGLGHVGIVEEVSSDGAMMRYSDMNGLSGFGRVGYSDWVPASTFSNFIYQ